MAASCTCAGGGGVRVVTPHACQAQTPPTDNTPSAAAQGGKKVALRGGGGVTRTPIFPTPPPLLGRRDGRGRSGRGCPTCRAGGEGVNPTSMAQNDTHVALIILTTQMWGGGDYWEKKLFRPKFVFLRLRCQHPFLNKTKGPTRNPISPPPPPLLRRASMSPPSPPPPPAEQFSGRPVPFNRCP